MRLNPLEYQQSWIALPFEAAITCSFIASIMAEKAGRRCYCSMADQRMHIGGILLLQLSPGIFT